jgi:hypothetical protein
MNIRRLYGNQFQVTKAKTIAGKFGTISIHAPGILRVTPIDAATASRLAALPGVGIMCDGSAIFAPAEFEAVNTVIQCRKKRKSKPLGPAARARLLAIGAKHRFRPGRPLKRAQMSADAVA